jgi:hypothetical protein
MPTVIYQHRIPYNTSEVNYLHNQHFLISEYRSISEQLIVDYILSTYHHIATPALVYPRLAVVTYAHRANYIEYYIDYDRTTRTGTLLCAFQYHYYYQTKNIKIDIMLITELGQSVPFVK